MSEEEGKPIAITWTEVTKVWHSESVEAAECQEWKAVSAVEQEWLDESVRACPGRLGALSVFHSKSVLYGAFVWARRPLNSHKWRFPARAGSGPELQLAVEHLPEPVLNLLHLRLPHPLVRLALEVNAILKAPCIFH
jgi:hypothetical protein